MLKKAVIYARVSSKEQQQEGFSIPAQLKALREYAAKNNIQVVKEYTDAETAKSTGRIQFMAMLQFMRTSKVRSVLVEKTDRLYRNFKDYVTVDEIEDIEIHLVKEGETISKDSKSHQKFIHGIKVLMAKNYIDNLSEEAKKGLYEKAARGQYPGRAPTGYLNIVNEATKEHIMGVDGLKAPLVKQMYDLYSTAKYSLDAMTLWAQENGLCSCASKPLSRSNIERILKNPVYYGDFVYSGKQYKGTHDPIVTKSVWDAAQKAFKRQHRITQSSHSSEYMFSGLIACSDCGCAIVAECKKGKYIYYHCSGWKKDCTNNGPYVREEELDKQFENMTKSLKVSDGEIAAILDALKKSFNDKNRFRDESVAGLRKQLDGLTTRMDKAYLDKLDGKISEDYWESHHRRMQNEMDGLQAQLEAYGRADGSYYKNGEMILKLAKNAHELYLSATNDEKKDLLKMLLSNCRLRGATIEYQMQSAFQKISEWASRPAVLSET